MVGRRSLVLEACSEITFQLPPEDLCARRTASCGGATVPALLGIRPEKSPSRPVRIGWTFNGLTKVVKIPRIPGG